MQEENQSEKALELVKKLFSQCTAIDLREDLNQIFYGYLSSEISDSQRERSLKSSTYLSLIDFLTRMSNLPKIDSRDRL
jgi:hypothetical protein